VNVWILTAYLLSQFALGFWASRRVSSEEEYFLAGRRLGAPLVAFSLFATWFGAESCLGAAGAVYSNGLSGARADPFGYACCLLLMGLLLVRRLYSGRFVTLGDLFRSRYGAGIERAAVLVLVPSSLIWGAAQVRAFGQVLSVTMSVEVTWAIYFASAIVIAYTYLGGLLGDVITDFVQGLLMAFCLLLLLGVAAFQLGGVSAFFASITPERLTFFPAGESMWAQLDRLSVPIFGSLIAQELIARVLSARSMRTAQIASFWSAGIYLLVGASPVLLGLAGPQLMPHLQEPEQLLPRLAEQLLPQGLYALFCCALLAAILSTVDSILLASSALVAHNVLTPLLRIERESQKLLLARLCVVLFGVFALVVALSAGGIYELVETASAFGTAGVLVVTLSALYLPVGGPKSAGAALAVGLLGTPVFEYLLGWPAPFLATLCAATLAYLLSAWLWEPKVVGATGPREAA
jgi:solute:Na+ symporter, SSS family